METKKDLADSIKYAVQELNRLINEAKENNLIVEIRSNEPSLGYLKDRYEVKVYEKIMY